jgi:hypothetical protein
MFGKKKAPSLAVIFGGAHPPEGHEHDEHDDDEDLEGLSLEEISSRKHDAAEEAIKAIKSGDVERFLKAIDSLHDLHTVEMEHEPEEHDDEEHDEDDDEEAAE